MTLDHFYKTISKVPAPIKTHPTADFTVNSSCKNTNAITVEISSDTREAKALGNDLGFLLHLLKTNVKPLYLQTVNPYTPIWMAVSFCFFQRQGDSDYISTRNIPYGKIGLWSYDESVTAADIRSELSAEFRNP